MNKLKKLISFFNSELKVKSFYVLIMVTGLALLETLSIVSIMPFLSVLANPEVIKDNQYLAYIYRYLLEEDLISNNKEFLIALGIMVLSFMVLTIIYKMMTHFIMNNHIESCRHDISLKVLLGVLGNDYEYFMLKHSADITKTIISDVDQLSTSVIRPAFNMFAYGMVFLSITMLLLVTDPYLAIITAGALLTVYAIIFVGLRNILESLGQNIININKNRFVIISELLSNIKNIKFTNIERKESFKYEKSSNELTRNQAKYQTLSMMPHYVIELLLFIVLMILVNYLLFRSQDGNLGSVLPIIGLYAFSAYRLKPAAQHFYHGLSSLRYGKTIIDKVESYIEFNEKHKEIEAKGNNINFEVMQFKELEYQYSDSNNRALININLKIEKGDRIGIVGKTGSGKSTLIDMMLGLLKPTSGEILINNKKVACLGKQWRSLIGYVPQNIVLSDESIGSNIALGVDSDFFDHDEIFKACEISTASDFVYDLENTINTKVGERGVRLSGGQLQRIGLARALYRKPEILVFDEATSALDNLTERKVMSNIFSEKSNMTFIMVAHRLSTLKMCNKLIILENGKIVKFGDYKEIIKSHEFSKYV